jgi:cytoskeletal protein RodZ
MNDKKSKAAWTPEAQPEPSGAVSADGGSKAELVEPKESLAPARSSGAAANVTAEKAPAAAEADQSLGRFLVAARERRGLTAEDVVRETRLAAHYVRMMETNDYSKISDQLYLVPFLRRYASFLELDQDDVALRFVREVQHAESGPAARLDRPLVSEPGRHRGWAGAVLVIGLLATAAGVYFYESDRHRQANTNGLAPQASANAVTGADGGATSIVPQAPASR